MEINDFTLKLRKQRNRLYTWLRRNLIGPELEAEIESDDYDISNIFPLDRYPIGVLFPIFQGISGTDPASQEEFEEEEDEDENESNDFADQDRQSSVKPSKNKRRYVPPTSVGFSFYSYGKNIKLHVNLGAIRYEKVHYEGEQSYKSRTIWKRKTIEKDYLADFISPVERKEQFERINVLEKQGEVFVLWRPYGDGWLTTISLSNLQIFPDSIDQREYKTKLNQLSLFEIQLECVIETGEVGIYPRVNPLLLSKEEQEIEFQYKDRKIYAIGHGAAVDWEEDEDKKSVFKIQTEFFPKVEVPQVSVDVKWLGSDALEIKYLSGYLSDPIETANKLEKFVDGYEKWISRQKTFAEQLLANDRTVAERIVSRMNQAVARMKMGLSLLQKDSDVAHAFAIANDAMYIQMKQYDRSKNKTEQRYRWRPFQLAFLLMAIESVVNENSEFRDTLDLIWFPTGGGKTEAYLALIAFLIIWRRLHHPTSGGGTSVLMRYTLRLLTKQQFQRAARLICALELIRKKDQKKFGSERITVGMWVGEASSPNTYKKACQILKGATKTGVKFFQGLVLDSCPWCNQQFVPDRNFIASSYSFEFICSNQDCEFGCPTGTKDSLPCQVVDEALYKNPPSLLIATIDKFARLAWEERASAFFGQSISRPPELVIQDELHLITGALGSIAGLYEAALDTILQFRGVYPKYIASTATIRMAQQQVQSLYGRSVAVFPPPGLSIDDSYFSHTVPIKKKPGRLYLGYFAHGLTRQKSLAPLAAAILSAPELLYDQQEGQNALMDAWWTIVVYHGSLKGVGVSHNILNIEVPDYWKQYASGVESLESDIRSFNKTKSNDFTEAIDRLSTYRTKIAQLTSISSPDENALTLKRLELPHSDSQCIDVVLATNMISVGLDVSRLSSMIINGQPLTTAEYIQATSRVGRGEIPGIVITNYYRDQVRSQSHYESFRPYHESFYRFVEPSSITPFTYQARQRALHASLVIAIRHSCKGLKGNQSAGSFNNENPDVRKVIELLITRCRRADSLHGNQVEKHLIMLVEEWKHEAIRCCREKRRLDYSAPDNNNSTDRLLYNHDDRIKGLWSTLQSMRNIENTALLKLL